MRWRGLTLVALLAGCPSVAPEPDPPAPLALPEPDALPFRASPPPLLEVWSSGAAITTAAEWEAARGEQIALLQRYVYGTPAEPGAVSVDVVSDDSDGAGRLVQAAVSVPGLAAPVALAVFSPPGPGPFPVLLGVNKCGNQTVTGDARVALGTAWTPSDCPGGQGADSRGSRAGSWEIEAARAAGWAVATLHQNELAPDGRSESASAGLLAGAPPSEAAPWGAVAAWAWGLSRTLDALEELDGVDAARIVPVGHSRRGKAALLAAALDPRFAGAIPHQSGTAGVTLSRSDGGESVASITTIFPHWFTPRFAGFADNEGALPFDQHHLVALVAPRPLLVTDGEADTWADPPGAAWSIELASPAWALYGEGGPSHVLRPGGHEVQAGDWAIWLDWLDDAGL